MDVLRQHIFKYGHQYTYEYGDVENKTEFENIRKYSPLHNIFKPNREKQYPPILVIAAEKDERAVLCNSLKYIAELQHTLKGNRFQKYPALLRAYKGAGHTASEVQSVEEATVEQIFLHLTFNW